MNANDGSVIVATGTAPGRGDRILVRCSGDGVLAHVDDLLSGRGLDAARRVYERAGFRMVGEAEGDTWGTRVREQRFELDF